MQENEFEKSVREKLDELHLFPATEVWEKVEAEIRIEKRKRRILFILFASFIIAFGTVGWFFYGNTNKAGLLTERKDDPSFKNFANKKPEKIFESEAGVKSAKKIDKTIPFNIGVTRNMHLKLVSEKWKAGTRIFEGVINAKKNKNNQLVNGLKNQEIVLKQHVNTNNKKDANLNTLSITNSKKVTADIAEVSKTYTEKNSANKTISESDKDTFSTTSPKISLKKKISFGFTLSAGISNNLSSLPIISSLVNAGNQNAYADLNSVGSPSSAISRLQYKSSFTYGFGLYILKQYSNKVSISAGMNYHFVSATSFVGSRNNSTQRFYDSTLKSSKTVTEFYTSGNSVKYTNKYYLLEMPVTVYLQLNKNKSGLIFFTAGISPAIFFSSKALYANRNQSLYYEEKDQFRKMQLPAQIGIQFLILKSGHFNLTAGPEVSCNLTNMAKPVTGTTQHLFSGVIKTNIQIK